MSVPIEEFAGVASVGMEVEPEGVMTHIELT